METLNRTYCSEDGKSRCDSCNHETRQFRGCPECKHICCHSCQVSPTRGTCWCKYGVRGDAFVDEKSGNRPFIKSNFGYEGPFKSDAQIMMETTLTNKFSPSKPRLDKCSFSQCPLVLTDDNIASFMLCPECQSTVYCSLVCQKADLTTESSVNDWRTHAAVCGAYVHPERGHVSPSIKQYRQKYGRYPHPLGDFLSKPPPEPSPPSPLPPPPVQAPIPTSSSSSAIPTTTTTTTTLGGLSTTTQPPSDHHTNNGNGAAPPLRGVVPSITSRPSPLSLSDPNLAARIKASISSSSAPSLLPSKSALVAASTPAAPPPPVSKSYTLAFPSAPPPPPSSSLALSSSSPPSPASPPLSFAPPTTITKHIVNNTNTKGTKKGKRKKALPSIVGIDFKMRAKDQTLSKLTNAQLKAFLVSRGITSSGVKDVLIGRVMEALEHEM